MLELAMDSDRTILGPSTTSLSIVDGKEQSNRNQQKSLPGVKSVAIFCWKKGAVPANMPVCNPPGGILVTDLGSSNGTFINGTRVEKGIAKAGDELAFDTARYKVEGLASVQAEVTTLAPPIVVAAKVTSDIEPIPAPPPPVASESKTMRNRKAPGGHRKMKAGSTNAHVTGASAAPATNEGTQVMAALSVAEPSLVGLSGSVKGQSFKLSGDRWENRTRCKWSATLYWMITAYLRFMPRLLMKGDVEVDQSDVVNGSFVNRQRCANSVSERR